MNSIQLQEQIIKVLNWVGQEQNYGPKLKLSEGKDPIFISEGMFYHIENNLPINDSIYRPQSMMFLKLFVEARGLYDNKQLILCESDKYYFDETDLGKFGNYNGIKVPLDLPLTEEFLNEVLEEKITFWKNLLPNSEIIPASALKKFNTSYIFDRIVAVLPESAPYYEKDQLTDKSERFFVSEIIREKILLFYDKEVPYSVEIIVEDFKEKPEITVIRAVILVSRESQKPIIIGDGGRAIKKLGTEARKDIEKFLDKKVYLDLNVKVDPDWRDNELRLKRMGYTE
jgi:GTP-binding protein Era